MYAEVIVGIQAEQLDRVFHYRIPPDLTEQTVLGSQVIVPFGPKKVNGIVVGFTATTEIEETKIRNLLSVKPSESIVNPELLLLAKWMSQRYGGLLVDSLRCIMPAGLEGKIQETYSLTNGVGRQEYMKLLENEPQLAEIIKVLLELSPKGINYQQLANSVEDKASLRRRINRLRKMELIESWQEEEVCLKPKTERFISLTPRGRSIPEEEIELTFRSAPKQLAVFKHLYGVEQPVIVSELNKRFSTSIYSAVQGLEKKGLVKVEILEVFRNPLAHKRFTSTVPPKLTGEQRKVVGELMDLFRSGGHRVALLHGITGSGKTEVYMRLIEHVVQGGKQVIVLVPEIALTPQMVERLYSRFGGQIAVLHSRLSSGERYDEWRRIKLNKSKIIVGARSAVFAPVQNLGLIILDEEHENTYKQSDSVHYHAREVAIERARLNSCPVVLGSATPSIESYYLAQKGVYSLHKMNARVGKSLLPKVHLIDMREELKVGNRTIFSRMLRDEMGKALAEKEQIILFMNRRGFSTFLLCRECGYRVKCRNCDVSMTYHLPGRILNCHYCGYSTPAPNLCPSCGGRAIRHFGTGTQRIEEEVKKVYPEANVGRLDLDSTSRKGSHEQILNQFKSGCTDILIGTQMVAKGLDFPKVGLVGVMAADTALNFPDFRSAERTFQLLTQVAGRAGRGDKEGRVVVQTYNPDHYSIVAAANHDYDGFFEQEIVFREQLNYPPFSKLVRILVSGSVENQVAKAANDLASILRGNLSEGEELLGPTPAPLLKIRERFRWHMVLKGNRTDRLLLAAKNSLKQLQINGLMGNNHAIIDINPQDML